MATNSWFYKNADQKKWLYEHGEVAEGEVIIETSRFITIMDILTSLFNHSSPYQRRLNYKFVSKDGKEHSGEDYINVFFGPEHFFATESYKTNILYSIQEPKFSSIITNRENKKYNKRK